MTIPFIPLNSIGARQKIGMPNQLGNIILGWLMLGDEDNISGIYKQRRFNGKLRQLRHDFYPYPISRTTIQQNNRSKFAMAVSAWQGLANSNKAEYNKRAIGRRMFGYHLFIKEYMKS